MLGTSNLRSQSKLMQYGVAVSLLGSIALSQSATGQAVFVTETTGPVAVSGARSGGGVGGSVGAAAVKDYGKLLNLTDDQKEMLEALHEGYRATYLETSRAQASEIREVLSGFNESHDMSIIQDDIPAIRQRYGNEITANEEAFFEDLKLLLSDEQLELFPRVERHRRRDTLLRRGFLSGESVDLIDIVNDMELSDGLRETINPELDRYEMDIDRALLEKKALTDDGESQSGVLMFNFEDEEVQERVAKTREASVRIRNLNESFARKVKLLLPEAEAAKFTHAFDVAAFPDVYSPTHASKCLDTAQGFADLTTDQAEQIAVIRESYEREASAIHERWARAKRSQEEDGNRGGFLAAGGGQVIIAMRTDNEEEVTDPVEVERKAKRELDTRTNQKLASVLTTDQQAKLPEAPKQHEGGETFISSDGVGFSFERTVEIRSDGDGR